LCVCVFVFARVRACVRAFVCVCSRAFPCSCAHSQKKGEYERWQNNNEFQLVDLLDVPAAIRDVKDETSWMYDWAKGDAEGDTKTSPVEEPKEA